MKLLNTNENGVRSYLWHVQKHLGYKFQSRKLVISLLNEFQPEKPSPEKLAEIIRDRKLVEPPKIKKAKPISEKAKKFIEDGQKISGSAGIVNIDETENQVKQNRIIKTSHLDHERLPREKQTQCPHGVPTGQVCALCDPRKFREMTGID